jgi:hypothetical protein
MICPQCGQADQVEKASTIYVRGIEVKWHRGKAIPPEGIEIPSKRSKLVDGMPTDELLALTPRLAPPAVKKGAPMRAIHPDHTVLALSMVAPLFLYGIFTSQPSGLLVVLPLLTGFYAFYFWQRKRLIAKFHATQQAQKATEQRIHKGIQRWMRLYYCARDDGVFEPGASVLTPTDQMPGLLFRE